MSRIEICGGIASGKTTLARILARTGREVALEEFRSNPFWRDFCANPSINAFETELTFLLQHYHAVKSRGQKPVVYDFSFLLDLAYANLNLTGTRRAVFQGLYDEVLRELKPPGLIVNLQCSAKTEMLRIKARGREEERALDFHYINAVNDSVGRVVSDLPVGVRVVTIDSERENFAASKSSRVKVATAVIVAHEQLEQGK